MEHKFQWSAFVDETRQEQVVVRCDDWAEFLEAIDLMKTLLPAASDGSIASPAPDSEPEIPPDQCPIHNKQMKERTGKNGQRWFDHRWKEGEVWYVCNGKNFHVQGERNGTSTGKHS